MRTVLFMLICWLPCFCAAQVPLKSPPSVIYHSTDGGRHWTSYDNGIPKDAIVSSFLVKGNKIFASTDHHGIFAIREGEPQWQRIDQDLPEGIDINAITSIGNSLIIATLRHGILISTNGGKNWVYPSMRIKNVPFRCLLTKGSLLFAGADDGIYISSDRGYTWKQVYKGVQVNGFTAQGRQIYAALMNGAIATQDNGATWKYIYEPHTLHDISNDGENIYAMTLGDGLLKSGSREGFWEDIQHGLGTRNWTNINYGLGTLNLYTFELKKFDDRIFAAQWYGIYVSENGGKNWSIIKNGLPDSTAFTTMEITSDGLIAGAVISLHRRP